MKERFKVCSSCGTIHLIHHSFKDKRPTCYKCGRTSFEDVKNTETITDSYTPIFCDWNLQHSIDDSAVDLVDYIEEKNGETIPAKLKSDIHQYFIFAANTNRKGFVNAMSSFKDYMDNWRK